MKRGEYRVRLLRTAETDLTDVVTYVAADNPRAAESVLDRIEASLGRLSRFPNAGTTPRETTLAGLGYRYLVVDSWLIFYTVEKRTVLIHRIVHGARDYRDLLGP